MTVRSVSTRRKVVRWCFAIPMIVLMIVLIVGVGAYSVMTYAVNTARQMGVLPTSPVVQPSQNGWGSGPAANPDGSSPIPAISLPFGPKGVIWSAITNDAPKPVPYCPNCKRMLLELLIGNPPLQDGEALICNGWREKYTFHFSICPVCRGSKVGRCMKCAHGILHDQTQKCPACKGTGHSNVVIHKVGDFKQYGEYAYK